MKYFLLTSFLVLTSLSSSISAQSATDEEMWQILQKAAAAARALNYQGIFVCQKGQQSKSVQITHLFNGKSEFARNVMLDGSPREVLSQDKDLVIYNPKNEQVIIEKRRGENMFPAILPSNLEAIKENYTLRSGELERIAGRQAQVLFLETKDNYRYSYQFWIDTEFGLLLKSALLNQRHQVIESMAFNQLSLMNSVDLNWFKPKFDSNKRYVMENEVPVIADQANIDKWVIKDLPAGYRKVDQITRMEHHKTTPVTQIVFSDGLGSVSLFVEQISKQSVTNNSFKSSYGTVGNANFYVNTIHGYRLTAVGEVPEMTVNQIVNAMIFKK